AAGDHRQAILAGTDQHRCDQAAEHAEDRRSHRPGVLLVVLHPGAGRVGGGLEQRVRRAGGVQRRGDAVAVNKLPQHDAGEH
ncbi:hypothetical protein DVW31_16700, partial [Enterococcus faecium]